MALTAADKSEIVKKYQLSKNDTGSSEVQVAILSAEIDYLTEHLKIHKHDFHTRYGLTNKVSKRRRLLDYIKRKKPTVYRDLLKKLDMRG